MWPNGGFNYNNGFRGCNPPFPNPCFLPCGPNGCPILLDTDCSIYHKNMNQISGLKNLNLPNGSTLTLILDSIDAYLGQLNVSTWVIPTLRSLFTINNLAQFGNAVDTEIGLLLTAVSNFASGTTLSSTDSDSIEFDLTGPGNRNISADVKISGTAGNQLSIQSDGLYSQAQDLSIDYAHNTLSIDNGNTVDFSSIIGVGWKGNVTSDPVTPADGQYWYRTDSGQLKIQLNGATRIITIT